jgi:hypothetical protein
LYNHCQHFCRTFSETAQNLMHIRCQIHSKLASGQIHDSK